MAGNQLDNLMLLDLSSGLPRTPESGGTPDVLQLSVDLQLLSGANLLVDGDLTVNGTTTTVHSETVLLADNHLYLNAGYTTAVAQTGGFVVNVLPTATATTVAGGGFTAGVPATSNPTVATVGSGTFAAGDIIQISGATEPGNSGLFEVLTHVTTTLTIRGIGTSATTQDWFQNQFTTSAGAVGAITLVNVNVLRGTSAGIWQTFTGSSSTGLTYSTFTTQGTVDLQTAYVAGNTITTSVGEGNLIFAGTELVQITATNGLDLNSPFDFDGASFDVLMSGSNGFSIDGTAASNVTATGGNLTLSTLTTGSVLVQGVGGVAITSSGGTVTATAGNNGSGTGFAASVTAGNSTGSNGAGGTATFTAGNGNGTGNGGAASLIAGTSGAGATGNGGAVAITAGAATSTDGNGGNIVATIGSATGSGTQGLFRITGNNNEEEALLELSGTGTNGQTVQFFGGSSDPNGSVTAPAASVFLRDTGGGGEVYVNNSTGSGTSWTLLSTAAGTTLQSAYEAGNTITTSGGEGNVTITGTEDLVVTVADFLVDTTSFSLDSTTSSNVTVTGAQLQISTATSGELDLTSAGLLDINAAANIDVDVTGTFDVLATSTFSIDGTGASNISATSGNLVVSTITSGTVDVTSAADIQMTFATNNAAGMVIDDGSATFINFDSTTNFRAVEVNQFLDVVGSGGGVTLTAGANLAAGNIVRFNASGEWVLADANTGTLNDGVVAGVASFAATSTNPARVFTMPGSLVPMLFGAAPAGASNGATVFLSATAGEATLTAPTTSGSIIFKLGILQGADGADTTPAVLYQPEFIAQRA